MTTNTEARNILATMTAKQLREIAKRVHTSANDVTIRGYSRMIKAELIRQLSFDDAWYFAEMIITETEMRDQPMTATDMYTEWNDNHGDDYPAVTDPQAVIESIDDHLSAGEDPDDVNVTGIVTQYM